MKKIYNLNIISEEVVPCVMNIIARYYNNDNIEEIILDVPEHNPDYFIISINEDKYIIVSKRDESKIINSCLDDDFEEWCTENRVNNQVRQYIDEDSWRNDYMLDIEDILKGEYLTEFDRYNVYQCNN